MMASARASYGAPLDGDVVGEVDPPAVHYLVVSRRHHRNGPAEMIRNAQTHVANYRSMHTAWLTSIHPGPCRRQAGPAERLTQ
jgi:hypothetical protein